MKDKLKLQISKFKGRLRIRPLFSSRYFQAISTVRVRVRVGAKLKLVEIWNLKTWERVWVVLPTRIIIKGLLMTFFLWFVHHGCLWTVLVEMWVLSGVTDAVSKKAEFGFYWSRSLIPSRAGLGLGWTSNTVEICLFYAIAKSSRIGS